MYCTTKQSNNPCAIELYCTIIFERNYPQINSDKVRPRCYIIFKSLYVIDCKWSKNNKRMIIYLHFESDVSKNSWNISFYNENVNCIYERHSGQCTYCATVHSRIRREQVLNNQTVLNNIESLIACISDENLVLLDKWYVNIYSGVMLSCR